jgi:cellulose synthase/poly-beta-1,6-N-acetylglucosamine synthase-like glycosyltransferase
VIKIPFKLFRKHRTTPSVTIGIPIYNGDQYLVQALDSITTQTYEQLEILVYDNCSTDTSPDIIARFAAKDKRIIVKRHDANIGGLNNFRATLVDARHELFMWAAHDDIWPCDFVASAVKCMQSDPSAVLVNTETVLIDQSGCQLSGWPSRPQLCDLKDKSYPSRIREVARRVGWCIYGLSRKSALLKTSIMWNNSITLDVLLTYELAAMGSFRLVKTRSPFRYRLIPKSDATLIESFGADNGAPNRRVSDMFMAAVNAIQTSGKTPKEISSATSEFIKACAEHAEWWPQISAENQLDPTIPKVRDRVDALSNLCASASVGLDKV